MAQATLQVYQAWIINTLKGDIDHDTVVFKAMLVSASYTPNMDTHDFLNDVVANEVTGTNWAAGGQAVTLTVTGDAGTNEVRIELADISVPTVTLTGARYVVVYNSTPGSDATRHLVGYGAFHADGDPGTPVSLAPTAGTLAIDWENPIAKFTY